MIGDWRIIIIIIMHYLAGRLSLEKKTYNVTENEGSVEICAVLTGGVLKYSVTIYIPDIAVTANFPSKISLLIVCLQSSFPFS